MYTLLAFLLSIVFVYPAIAEDKTVSTAEELQTAIITAEDGDFITLEEDISNVSALNTLPTYRAVTINGQNHKIISNEAAGFYLNTGDYIVLQNIAELSGFSSDTGAVLRARYGDFDVSNVTFKNNKTTGTGGAIRIENSHIGHIKDSYFEGNEAQSGSAIYNQGTVYVIDTSFKNNVTTRDDSTRGGAIYNAGTVYLYADKINIDFSGTGTDLFNVNGTAYLNANKGKSITFNDKVRTSGNSVLNINQNVNNFSTRGEIVLKGPLTGHTINLYDGYLRIDSGNLIGSVLVANGGTLSLINDVVSTVDVGTLDVSSKPLLLAIDADLENGTFDTFNEAYDSSKLQVSEVNLINENGTILDFGTQYSLTADVSILGENNYIYQRIGDNKLSIAIGDLPTAVVADGIRSYSMNADEIIGADLGQMNGSSLTIKGNGYKIDGGNHDGILVVESQDNQELNISDVTFMNFRAVINSTSIGSISGVKFLNNNSEHNIVNLSGWYEIKDSLFKENKSEMAVLSVFGEGFVVDTDFIDNDAPAIKSDSYPMHILANNKDVVFSGNKTADGKLIDLIGGSGFTEVSATAGHTVTFNGEVQDETTVVGGTVNFNNKATLFSNNGIININADNLKAASYEFMNYGMLNLGDGILNYSITGDDFGDSYHGGVYIKGDVVNNASIIWEQLIDISEGKLTTKYATIKDNIYINLSNDGVLNITDDATITHLDGTGGTLQVTSNLDAYNQVINPHNLEFDGGSLTVNKDGSNVADLDVANINVTDKGGTLNLAQCSNTVNKLGDVILDGDLNLILDAKLGENRGDKLEAASVSGEGMIVLKSIYNEVDATESGSYQLAVTSNLYEYIKLATDFTIVPMSDTASLDERSYYIAYDSAQGKLRWLPGSEKNLSIVNKDNETQRVYYINNGGETEVEDLGTMGGSILVVNANHQTIDGDQHGGTKVGEGKVFTINGAGATEGDALEGTLTVVNSVKNFYADNSQGGFATNNGGEINLNNSVFSGNKTKGTVGGVVRNNNGTVNVIGGVMMANESESEVRNIDGVNKTVGGNGGAVYNDGILNVSDDAVFYNNTSVQGGVIYNAKGITTVHDAVFAFNQAKDDGGAIYAAGGNVEVYDSVFNANSADTVNKSSGGALFIDKNAKVLIDNTIFKNNASASNANMGGAIYNNGLLMVENGTVFESNVSRSGGAIYNVADAEISNTIFRNNAAKWVATAQGGAIYNKAGTFVLTNSLLTENTAREYGAAIYNDSGTFDIIETDITNNVGLSAVYNNSEMNIKDSVFAGNGTDLYQEGGVVLISGNDKVVMMGDINGNNDEMNIINVEKEVYFHGNIANNKINANSKVFIVSDDKDIELSGGEINGGSAGIYLDSADGKKITLNEDIIAEDNILYLNGQNETYYATVGANGSAEVFLTNSSSTGEISVNSDITVKNIVASNGNTNISENSMIEVVDSLDVGLQAKLLNKGSINVDSAIKNEGEFINSEAVTVGSLQNDGTMINNKFIRVKGKAESYNNGTIDGDEGRFILENDVFINGGRTLNSEVARIRQKNIIIGEDDVPDALLYNNKGVIEVTDTLTNNDIEKGLVNNDGQITIHNLQNYGQILDDGENALITVSKGENKGVISFDGSQYSGSVFEINGTDNDTFINAEGGVIEKHDVKLSGGILKLENGSTLNMTNQNFVSNGGVLDLSDNGEWVEQGLGNLKLLENLVVDIDVSMADKKADYLSAISVIDANGNVLSTPEEHRIVLSKLNIVNDPVDDAPIKIAVADNVLKDFVKLTADEVTVNGFKPETSWIVTYDNHDEEYPNEGVLKFEYENLYTAVHMTAPQRVYYLNADEQDNRNLTNMEGDGSTLIINGNNGQYSILGGDADDQSVHYSGITMTADKNLSVVNVGQANVVYNNDGYVEDVNVNKAITGFSAANGSFINTFGSVEVINSVLADNNATQYGGAIYARSDSDLSISDSVFTENSAQRGGAVYSQAENISIVNSVFFGNNTVDDKNGAAVDVHSGSRLTHVSITDTDFTDNEGGAVNLRGESVEQRIIVDELSGSFVGNTSIRQGGAIDLNYYTIAEAITADFIKNYVESDGVDLARGGAIINYEYVGNLSEKTETRGFVDNFAYHSQGSANGGAISNNYVDAEESYGVDRIKADFMDNYALGKESGFGGAIANNTDANIGYVEGNFERNYALADTGEGLGGAIYNDTGAAITVADADFIDNAATTAGGAIFNRGTANIVADEENVRFTGNKIGVNYERNEETKKVSVFNGENNDIFNDGVVNLNANNGKEITFDGAVDGHEGVMNVNKDDVTYITHVYDETENKVEEVVNIIGATIGTVNFNNAVNQGEFNVYNGTVNFNDSIIADNMNISKGEVNVAADCLEVANGVNNDGRINLGDGVLKSNIFGDEGKTVIDGEVTNDAEIKQAEVEIAENSKLTSDVNNVVADLGIANDGVFELIGTGKNTNDIGGKGELIVAGGVENEAVIAQDKISIQRNAQFSTDVEYLEKTDNIVNDGIFNVVGDRIDNNISGGGKINVNSSMELAGNINGENTVNLNEGNIRIADENTLGENVKLNIAKTGKAVKLAVETMAIRVKEVIFGKDAELSLDIKSLTDFGTITAEKITIEKGAKLHASLGQGLASVGRPSIVQLLSANNHNFNNFSDSYDEFENNMYKFEKEGNDGAYKISLIKTAKDVAKDAGAEDDIVKAAEAWVDEKPFADEKAQDIADGLAKLAQDNAKGFVKALRSIVPTAAPIVKTLTVEHDRYLSDMLMNHLYNREEEQVLQGLASGDEWRAIDASVWVKTYAGRSRLDAEGFVSGFDINRQGAVLGIDKRFDNQLLIGLGYGADTTKAKAHNRRDKVHTHSLFAYTQYKQNNWYINGLSGYSKATYEESKYAMEQRFGAKYNVDDVYTEIKTGYEYKLDNNMIMVPEAGLKYHYIDRKSYKDKARQHVSSHDMDVLTAVAGVKVSKEYELAENKLTRAAKIRPEAYIGAGYDLISDRDNAFVILANGADYRIHGNQLDRFFIETKVGAKASFTDDVDLSMHYIGQYRGNYRSHAGMLELKVRF